MVKGGKYEVLKFYDVSILRLLFFKILAGLSLSFHTKIGSVVLKDLN